MAQVVENTISKQIFKHIGKVKYFCDAENISGNIAVHEIRKSFKRFRAWLRFYKEQPEDELIMKVLFQFRDFNRQLGPIRESYINLTLFDKHFSNKKFLPERKVKQILDDLLEVNQNYLQKLGGSGQIFEGIRKNFLFFESRMELNQPGGPDINHIAEELSLSHQKCVEAYEASRDDFCSEKLHQLRIKLKQLWYQCEVVKSYNQKYFALKNRQLNDLTELMGIDHDNYILSLTIAESYFSDLLMGEQDTFNNLIQHQHELTVNALHPKLKQFFSENTEVFTSRIDTYLKDTTS